MLAVRENCIPEDFLDVFRRWKKEFKKLEPACQARLGYLIWNVDAKRRAHRACALTKSRF